MNQEGGGGGGIWETGSKGPTLLLPIDIGPERFSQKKRVVHQFWPNLCVESLFF